MAVQVSSIQEWPLNPWDHCVHGYKIKKALVECHYRPTSLEMTVYDNGPVTYTVRCSSPNKEEVREFELREEVNPTRWKRKYLFNSIN